MKMSLRTSPQTGVVTEGNTFGAISYKEQKSADYD